jgi:hypothetical protein
MFSYTSQKPMKGSIISLVNGDDLASAPSFTFSPTFLDCSHVHYNRTEARRQDFHHNDFCLRQREWVRI